MRKVLSLVLVLALVLSSFSMAFADDTATTANAGLSDIEGKDCEQAAIVLMDLGVITGYTDGTFRPDANVTRAEAAVIVIKMLGLEKSVGTQKSNYTDLAGYGWAEPYIAFASNLGILQGDGNGKYRPGDPVSYNEFAKIMVAALGYTADSLTGTWPGNYVNKAMGLGIMDDVVSGGNAPATRGDVAIMVNNNLTNFIGTIDKDGNFQATVVKTSKDANGDTVYEYDTPVYRLGGSSETGIILPGDDAVINTRGYVGKFCEYYTNKDGEIIAVKEVKSTTLDGKWDATDKEFTADDVDYTTVSDLDLEDNAKITYTVKNSHDTSAQYFVNAKSTAIPAGGLVDDTSYVIEAKVSGKTIKEVYSVSYWEATAALKVAAGDLEDIKEKDPSLLGYDFDTNKDGSINDNSFELVGVKSLSDIKADNIVYVYSEGNAAKENIVKVAVGTEVVEGEITKINTKDDEWTVNGKAYGFSAAPGAATIAYNKLGDEVKLYVDAYGDIYDYDKLSGTADNYAILKYASSSREEVKLYMADESSKMFSTDVSDDAKTLLGHLDGTDGYLVGYSLDKNGVVDTLEAGYTAGKAKIVDQANVVTYSGVLESKKVLGDYRIDDDVVVFTAKTINADGSADISDDLGTTTIGNLDKKGDNPGNKLFALYLDDDGKTILAMIVDVDLDNGTGADTYAVISDRAYQKNAAGEKAYNLTGFIDGKAMKDVFTAKEGTGDYTGANSYATNVLVYKLKYDEDGNISKLTAQGPAEGATKATDGGLYVEDDNQKVSNGYLVVNSAAAGAGTSTTCAISANAVVYSVTFDGANVDEYARFNGTFKADHMVWLFETNDDEDGYDIVVYAK